MASINLNKEDYNIVESLINVSESLYENYIKLKKLEISGKKESVEYQKTINCLKTTLYLEESLYQKIENDKNSLNSLLNYFVSNPLNDLTEEIKVTLSNNQSDLIKMRIILRLITIKDKFLNHIKSVTKQLKVRTAVQMDILNTVLNILNRYLNDNNYQVIFNDLFDFKYNLSFMYKFIEEEFLNNNFNINPDLYISGNLVAELNYVPINYLQSYQNLFSKKLLDIYLFNTPKCSDNSDKKAILSEIISRACLIFIDEITIEKLRGILEKYYELKLLENNNYDD